MTGGDGQEGFEAVELAARSCADAAEDAKVGVGALHHPAAGHEAPVLGSTGLARIARNVGLETQGLDPSAERAVVEGPVGGEMAGVGADGDLKSGEGQARRR